MRSTLLRRWLVALLALGLLASACSSRDDDGDTAEVDAGTSDTDSDPVATDDDSGDPVATDDMDDDPVATDDAAPDPCADVTLEATEIGVTEDIIKVIVMADSDSVLAPGLFDGARVGAFAWADDVNSRGGLACRDVEIEFADSMLNREATVNGFLQACTEALALVGTTVLLGQDTTDLNSCPDAAGDPTGVPDFAYITTEVPHQCSTTSFHLSRPGASCPYDSGERDYVAAAGVIQYLIENTDEDLHGIYLIPGDFPSTRASAVPSVLAHEQLGVTYDGLFGVSGAATVSAFTPLVQRMRENDSNFIYNGSNDATMINMLQEAANQGLDLSEATVVCSLSCYTPAFIEQGDLVEGVYVWTFFLPFEEADTNEELANFMSAVDDPFPAAWAAGAWGNGVLFEQVINQIVERDGPNAITRQSVLDEVLTVTDFDVNGWWGGVDFSTTLDITDCMVLMQVQDGEYVRIAPAERGELACSDEAVIASTADPEAFPTDT